MTSQLRASEVNSRGLCDATKMFTRSNIKFGLVLVILLFTAPIVSQYIWQRAHAIEEKNTLGAFTIAGLGFLFVPPGWPSLA